MNTISDSRTYLESVLERNDKLLFLWHEYEQSYRLESFDIETKEAEVVWEFILPDDWYEPCLKLESAG